MAYLGVFLVAPVNAVILFFASYLAAGGDGSVDGVHRVWTFGSAWIALLTVVALVACLRKSAASGLLRGARTLPPAFVASIVLFFLGAALGI